MTTTTGTCARCREERTLHDEHILPLRLAKALADVDGSYSWTVGDTSGMRYPELTVPVCDPCNRKMNQHIEQPAECQFPIDSLIFPYPPGPVTLGKMQCKIVARWALKQMVLMSYEYFPQRAPQAFWDWLAKNGRPEPPLGTSIWVGLFVPDAPFLSEAQRRELTNLVSPTVRWGGSFYLNHLAVSMRYEEFSTFIRPLPSHPAEQMGYLVRLDWDTHGTEVLWPPAREINADTRDVIHGVFPVFGPILHGCAEPGQNRSSPPQGDVD